MALTVPTISTTAQCTVTVGSTDYGLNIPLVLTAAQVADWSDQQLTDRIAALKSAFEAFLSPGLDIQTSVVWMTQGFDTTVQTAEQVH
jgi:hypothetical protein